MENAFIAGFTLGASLIISIGAQNACVLRQGLARSYVGSATFTAIMCDVFLIGIGVLGLGGLINKAPYLLFALKYGAILFLISYGIKTARRAVTFRRGLVAAAPGVVSRKQVILQTLGFSLLNPHVYLDTVLLIGAVGAQLPEDVRPFFGLGASCASLVWFLLLGFGAARASEILATPRAWQAIEGATALCMFATAYQQV